MFRGIPDGVIALLWLSVLSLGAGEIPLSACPPEVKATIRSNLHDGKIDEIKRIQIEEHILYIVKIDLRGFHELELFISGSGKLRKSVEEIGFRDLPSVVRDALKPMLEGLNHTDDIEKVNADNKVRYHVEIERLRKPDLHLVFDEDGSITAPE